MNLKNHFAKLDKDHLEGELNKLVKLYPQIKEHYEGLLTLNGDQKNLEKYKTIIKNEFFPTRGFGKCRLPIAKKAMRDYIKIARSNHNIAGIMVYYVEMGARFTHEYGDIDMAFYVDIQDRFEDALDFVNQTQYTR